MGDEEANRSQPKARATATTTTTTTTTTMVKTSSVTSRVSVVATVLAALMVAGNLGPACAQTRRWSTSARSSSSSSSSSGGGMTQWTQCYNGVCTSGGSGDGYEPAPVEEDAPVVEDAPVEEDAAPEQEAVVEEEMSLRDRMQARMEASRARIEEMRAQSQMGGAGDDSSPDEEVEEEEEVPVVDDEEEEVPVVDEEEVPIIEDPANETMTNTTGPLPPTESGRAALSLHNEYRARHGAPPLKWSNEVAEGATNWAQYLAQECKMEHNRDDDYGENLGIGYRDIEGSVNAWYNEESQYDYNNPGFSSATGHFTAMVWKSTTDLGCAVGVCSSGRKVYVCQYSPPGNSRSRFPENVLPPQ